MTLAKIRRVYSKTDCRSIAKMLGMSSHENATPIRILHNSAGHLSGPARSLGGVLVGYLGARTFVPRPVALIVENIGGTATLLGLVAMAKDVEGLYAAVKALVCVVRSNRSAQQEMDRMRRYQSLAMLLKKKQSLLNSHILHLTFSLVGTVDSGRETTIIPNPIAFQDILCDLEVWQDAPGNLQRSLYEHFYELVAESSEQKYNLKVLRELEMVSRLLQILKRTNLLPTTSRVICNLLRVLLRNTTCNKDILCFGQFTAATLPDSIASENLVVVNESSIAQYLEESLDNSENFRRVVNPHNIWLRNCCLSLLHSLLVSPDADINHVFAEEVIKVLGFDWLLLFLQGHLHPTTIILGFHLLALLLSYQPLLQRFRESSCNGGWLTETEAITQNHMGVVLGFNMGTSNNKTIINNREIHSEAYQVPGFQHLQMLIVHHVHIIEVYFLLLSILLGISPPKVPNNPKLSLDSLWSYLFGGPTGQVTNATTIARSELCPEAVVVLLSMVRTLLNQGSVNKNEFYMFQDYPVTLLQFLMYLYHNRADFMFVCMSADVLGALGSTLFPIGIPTSEHNSEVSSPVDDIQSLHEEDNLVFVKAPEHISTEKGSCLISHPGRKFVMDFLRVIIVDSLSLLVTAKQAPVIDMLLEAVPVHSSHAQQCEFQTEVLSSLMDHLLAADVLLGEQAALPIATGGSYSYITPNVFYFTSCLVDKLWQGLFTRDSHEVLDFIIKLITQVKRRGINVSLESIYHSLNRTILYQLSRPADSVVEQMAILESLQKIISHRTIVLSSNNMEVDFFGCLCYCLLQLTEDAQINREANRRTTWHVTVSSYSSQEPEFQCQSPQTSLQEGAQLVAGAARRVWGELYMSKRQILEDVSKVALSGFAGQGSNQSPDIQLLRIVMYEPTSKLWISFLDTERKCGYNKDTWQLQSQLQSKLQKVTGGLSRLASRKIKREQAVRMPISNISFSDLETWTLTHISIVADLVELHSKQYQQGQQYLQKYVFDRWLQTESELTRERAVWGPPVGSAVDKWLLDMTEGPCRMRKKMIRNEWFFTHYPYRPEVEGGENKALKYKVATSLDSKEYYKHWRPENMVEQDTVLPDLTSLVNEDMQVDSDCGEEREIGFQGLRTACLLPRSPVSRSNSDWDEDQDYSEAGYEISSDQEVKKQEDSPDSQSVLRLLEDGEKISHMFRCARIQGLDTCEGLLLFGKEHFYVVDGFTLLKTREIRDIDSLPANMHDPIIPNSSPRCKHQKRMCSKFSYDDIREVHKRRYLLQPIALEVFSADGRNYLLAFPRKVRNKVYARFLNVATAITDNVQDSLSGQKRGASVESSANLLSSLIGETSVTQRWVRGEISNFQYLMHLNTLAGRSYNDLMQYPVFPWVLADYDSEELDFNDSETFRDFSKPMGAQTPDRLEQFQKRYKEWDDPHGETPPYHYGTFYSSAMIVASYLVRMEPFAQHFLRLQGGHFDLADRMFHSVKDAWLSASKHNMADVKELIPEFFYLPEFLINSNHFDLGCKQNGVQLDDVVLPSWAKSDAREFIRVHRQALECDHVSAHLHEWIDLIFGCKQQGPTAVEAVNVFHHLFYEGNVDIYNIDDPLKKNATIGFINNFGQIPKQLFKKPHPAKKLTNRTSVVDPGPIMPGLSYSLDKLFFHNLDNLRPSSHAIKVDLKGPVGQIIHQEKSLQAVEQNKILIPPHYNRYVAWGFADHSLRIGNYESDRATFVWEDTPSGEILCCACLNDKIIITAGTNSMVTLWQCDKKKFVIKQNLYGHTEPITCLAASRAYNLIVSGSRDRTCIMWDLSHLTFVRQLRGHPAPVAAVAINEVTGDIATCAGTYMYVWTINGDEIASVNTATGRSDRTQQILCVAFSYLNEWDNQNVVMTGSSDGVVRMWSTDYVQVPKDVNNRIKAENPEEEDQTDVKEQKSACQSDEESEVIESKAEQIVRRMSLAGTEQEEALFVESLLQQSTIRLSTTCTVTCKLPKSASGSSISEEEKDEDGDCISLEEDADALSQQSWSSKGEGDNSTTQADGKNALQYAIQHSKTVASHLSRQCTIEEEPPSEVPTTKATIYHSNTVGACTEENINEDSRGLRISKSDTSLTDSFVLVSEGDIFEAERTPDQTVKKRLQKRILREGFKWQCQLVFRSKLTMHTAFDRKDNTEPAAVTALAVSKDHKSVYVGDARGRVFSWSVTDHPGRAMADHWVRDEGGDSCIACGVRFSFAERRHHCRNCGQLFCSRCSRFESEISRLRILKPVRVCQACHSTLKAQVSENSSP